MDAYEEPRARVQQWKHLPSFWSAGDVNRITIGAENWMKFASISIMSPGDINMKNGTDCSLSQEYLDKQILAKEASVAITECIEIVSENSWRNHSFGQFVPCW
jgi:hypothetical protein